VTATCASHVLRVIVEDDGIGFDPAAVKHHSLGLAGIRERLTWPVACSPSTPGSGGAPASSPRCPLGKPIRVALCDDHTMVGSGLHRILAEEPGIEVAGEAARPRKPSS